MRTKEIEMLEVTARRKVTRPYYQVFETLVQLNGADKLTPKSARAALTVAFGGETGEVWYSDETGPVYGYRVYAKSARKIYPSL
jgi:hypothetical protein